MVYWRFFVEKNMLEEMKLRKFAMFEQADFCFAAGLNVMVGENGSGKTHAMKAAYAVMAAGFEEGRRARGGASARATPTKAAMRRVFADKLVGVFRCETLGRLVRRGQGRGRCGMAFLFDHAALNCQLSFAASSQSEVAIEDLGDAWPEKAPVFFPSRELLTLHPADFLSVYGAYPASFDQIYLDLCKLLIDPARAGPEGDEARRFLQPLEAAMGGRVVCDRYSKRFYLQKKGGRVEMPMVAEGVGKLAMLAHLIASGALFGKGVFFWDEPEANLNPRLIKVAAETLCLLCRAGMQVFVATHSLFLLKELEVLYHREAYKAVDRAYFGLRREEDGTVVACAKKLVDLPTLVMLDEEMKQSNEYMREEMKARMAG